MVYQDPTGCLTAFYFSPFEVRDDSNPSGNGLSHLNRINLGGAATQSAANALIALKAEKEVFNRANATWATAQVLES